MELRPYQAEAVGAIMGQLDSGVGRTLLVLPTGCHDACQPILMADGSGKAAAGICVGDKLMGPDGAPRTVLALHHGEDDMFRIVPKKGESFTVNGHHVLSLVGTSQSSAPVYPSERTGGKVVDVTVREYVSWSRWRKHIHKLYRAPLIERFAGNDGTEATIDPYFLGVLLGDGEVKRGLSVTTADQEVADEVMAQCEKYGMTTREEPAGKAVTYHMRSGALGRAGGTLANELRELGVKGKGADEKGVPFYYKTLPAPMRAQVVAGLLDTDGSLASACTYDFVSKSQKLANDLAFMCRSLGLAAYVSHSVKRAQGGFRGIYWRVSISGDCEHVIPCRVPHKKARARRQVKDVLRTGFSVEPKGRGEYYGFTVDGDNRYLLDDFTVTHNCGKTVVFASVAERFIERGGRVLVLAHRSELLEQAADKIAAVCGLGCAVEKAEQTSVGSWFSVTVGSVQTLARPKRLQAFAPDHYDLVVIDEAHHAVSDSYQAILDHFSGAKVLGVTATPSRADKKGLGRVFDTLAYQYTLPAAIRDGYLCPIEAQTVPLSLDLSGVAIQGGDFRVADLGTALDPYLEGIADEMVAAGCRDRRTVAFLPLVATSRKFRDVLASRGLRAAEVNGGSEDRAEVLAAFDEGAYDVLCNSMLLTEGWDCPSVDCIVVLRPTKSTSLYQQMVGRGTRLSPETGKESLLLLDFLWHTQRHKLCHPAHLIAEDDEVAERMTLNMAESGCPEDIEAAEAKAKEDVVREREESLAKQLQEMWGRKRRLVDPLQFEMSIAAEDLMGYEPAFGWEMAPASEGQLAALERAGICPDEVGCAGKASLLLDRLAARRAEGLATPKQIRCLERYGFQHVGTWPFEACKGLIDRIAANRWRVPRGIDPKEYRPAGEEVTET